MLLDCSEPLVVMMTKTVFKLVLLAVAGYSGFYLILACIWASEISYSPSRAMRVHILDLDAGPNASSPVISKLVPLAGVDSCHLDRTMWEPGPPGTGNLSFAGSWVRVQGFVLETAWEKLSGAEAHRMIAIPEGLDGNGVWQRLDDQQANFLCTSLLHVQFDSKGQVRWQTEFSLLPTWRWYVRHFLTALVNPVGLGLTLILAILKQQRRASRMLVATFWLTAGSIVTGMIGFLIWAADQPSKVCYCLGLADLTFGLPYAVLAAGLSFVQHQTVGVLLAFASIHMIGTIFRSIAVPSLLGYPQPEVDFVMEILVGPQAWALAIAVAILFFRRRAVKRAQALIHSDFLEYEAVWKNLIAEPEVLITMNKLADLLAGFKGRTKRPTIQFHNVLKSKKLSKTKSSSDPEMNSHPEPESEVFGQPIQSLDQVFFQAKCINPIFVRKVRQLAAVSNGGGVSRLPDRPESSSGSMDSRGTAHCKLMGTSGFVFHLAKQEEATGEFDGISWGSVKSVNRAIEKAIRAYRGVSTCK
jgi:hypothetical protein